MAAVSIAKMRAKYLVSWSIRWLFLLLSGASAGADGVVAADHRVASEVGAKILDQGGNAFDAAAATALALGVVNPASSGIGGGGLAVVYEQTNRQSTFFDFRERAPSALTPAHFDVNGVVQKRLSTEGGLAVGVPGEVAGLFALWKGRGRLSWAEVVAPAIALAQKERTASKFLQGVANRKAANQPAMKKKIEEWARGTIHRLELARTLQEISKQGPKAFYAGGIAGSTVKTVTDAGGVLTLQDLKDYRVKTSRPLVAQALGYEIKGPRLPSSGGFAIAVAASILETVGLPPRHSEKARHLQVEALKHAFADRARLLGEKGKLTNLLSEKRLNRMANKVGDKVSAHDAYGGDGVKAGTSDDSGTSHFCVIDDFGNAVSLTTTVNGSFGAKLITPGGVVLNNQIDDFSLAEGVANMYGLIQSEKNLVGGGKTPLSSMSPLLIFRKGKVVGCLGGSGGPRIISNVLQVFVRHFVYGHDLQTAIDSPRLHHQWKPDDLRYEPNESKTTIEALKARGHSLKVVKWPTAVQAISLVGGTLSAGSDSRKGGKAAYSKKELHVCGYARSSKPKKYRFLWW